MKKSHGKFFIIIGLLLVVAGFSLYSDDLILSVLGVVLGAYNTFKGIRIARGIQPIVYRKQKEYQEKNDDALENKKDNSD